MKKMINLVLILCACFFCINVYADTNIKVGESASFKNASCIVTNCTSSSTNVTVSFDENECKYTGASVGEALVEVTCEGKTETQKININVNDTNTNAGNANYDSTLYDNVTNAETNCFSLGLLRKDLQGIFKIFKIVAPILVIVLSIYDFIKAIAGKVDGEMKKVFMKLLKRLAFAMILFFLPNILDFFLGLVDPAYSTCINS